MSTAVTDSPIVPDKDEADDASVVGDPHINTNTGKHFDIKCKH